jgi:hypothetical protein
MRTLANHTDHYQEMDMNILSTTTASDESNATPKAARMNHVDSASIFSRDLGRLSDDSFADENDTRFSLSMDLRMGRAISMDTAELTPRRLRLLVDETLALDFDGACSVGDVTIQNVVPRSRGGEDGEDDPASASADEEGQRIDDEDEDDAFYDEKSVALRDLLVAAGEASMLGAYT